MSAEVIQAFEAEAHRLDAEADNMGTAKADQPAREMKHELAKTLRRLAQRSQGFDPAQVAAEEDAGGAQSGLAVERTDADGKAIGPPDDAQ